MKCSVYEMSDFYSMDGAPFEFPLQYVSTIRSRRGPSRRFWEGGSHYPALRSCLSKFPPKQSELSIFGWFFLWDI